ncbi:Ankyrin repeat-containing domain [Phytophthora cactorum]|nr:Ankyrin repeat-containing domain [Phytophthora cactorum]
MGNTNRSKTSVRATSLGRAQESERQLPVVPDVDVNATDAYGYTMLLFAARDGDVKKARFLLENNASVDIRTGYGATALHFAARGGSTRSLDCSWSTEQTKLVRLFLKHGADTSIRDAFGWNAERLAASAGHCKIFAAIQKHELRRSTSSYEALRWSQRSSGVFAALNLRLSTSMKDAKPRPEVSTPFPASAIFSNIRILQTATLATAAVSNGERWGQGAKGSKDEFTFEDNDGFTEALRVNLQRLIVYARSADTALQREVAEKLANEAVKPDRQVQIVELDGLQLLLPLTKSKDTEVQRLAAHALANLSVNSKMATEGGIDMLIDLLGSTNEHVQRQAAKALANLGVNVDNKERIAKAGGIKPLIDLASSHQIGVAVEAIAALANLAVNDANEVEIARKGGLKPIIDGAHSESVELQSQVARALRNLSVNPENKQAIVELGGWRLYSHLYVPPTTGYASRLHAPSSILASSSRLVLGENR